MTRLLRKTFKPEPAMRAAKPLLTSEQFLDWLEPGVHADLIGGEVFMHSPVNLRHATLTNFVDHLLRTFLDEVEDKGVLHRETVAVRLSVRETFLPDLCYFSEHQVPRLRPTHADFAPTLVVEALSPATARRDRGLKFAAYERAGVSELWLLDPETLDHKFYQLVGGMFEEFATGKARIESRAIPGFWLKRSWLNPDKTPSVKSCVREILRRAKR